MSRFLMRLIGHSMVQQSIAKHSGEGRTLDLHLGFAMLRDRRVPLASKLRALAIGAGAITVMNILQLPLDALILMMLPMFGIVVDAMINGVETIAGPIIIASLLLPHLAPKPVVQELRDERLRQLPTIGVRS